MGELANLPSWTPVTQALGRNPRVVLALIVLVGAMAGEVARRCLRLPRISGYLIAGLLLGPLGLGALSMPMLAQSQPSDLRVFVDVSLGLVLFELGQRLDARWLIRAPGLAAMSVAESALAALLVYAVLTYFFEFTAVLAAAIAAVAMASSPAVLMRIAAEQRAQGQVTERAMLLVATNSVLSVVAVSLIVPWTEGGYRGGWIESFGQAVYLLAGSVGLAAGAAWLTLRLIWLVGKRPDLQFVVLIGAVVLTVGAAGAFRLPVVATLLACGILVRSFDDRKGLLAVDFGRTGQLCYLVLFVLIGASLDLGALAIAWCPALAVVLARFIAKSTALIVFARVSRMGVVQGALLSIALVPMSGFALVLVYDAQLLYPALKETAAPVLLAAIAILEIIGPIAAQLAFKLAGEAEPESEAGLRGT